MHEQSRTCHTRLPRRRENARDHAIDYIINAHIVEKDVGALSAKFEDEWLEVLCGTSGNEACTLRTAGEPHFANKGVSNEGVARFIAVSGHDVQAAVRETGFLGQFAEAQQTQGVHLRWLHHHRITRCKCRRQPHTAKQHR